MGHVAALRRLAVEPFDERRACGRSRSSRRAATEGTERLDAPVAAGRRGAAEAGRRRIVPAGDVGAAGARAKPWPPTPSCRAVDVKVYAESGQFIAIGVVTDDRRLAPTRVFIR